MDRRLSLFSAATFFFGLFLLLLLPPRDPDLGWQLRCGYDLWQNHQLCNFNRYTIFMPGYNWPSHYWLYQAFIYPIYLYIGSWGLTIVGSFVITASLLLFYLTQPLLIAPITTLSLYFLSYSVFSLGIRGQLAGFFCFSILLYIFRNKSSPKTYWFGLLVIWIWAQVHGSFVIGVLFLLANFASDFIMSNRCPTKTSSMDTTKVSPSPHQGVAPAGSNFHKNYCRLAGGRLKKLMQKYTFPFPLLLLFPLTLLNPNGILIYEEAWRHFSTVKLNLLIAEWVPPTWPYVISLLTLLFINSFLGLKKFTLSSLPLYLFTLCITYLGLKARRFVPFSAITLLFYIAKYSTSFISFNKLISLYPISKLLIFTLCFFPLLFGVVYQLPKTLTANQDITNNCLKQSADSPCAAINFLQSQPDRSPLFNRYEWGGILNWNLPEFPLFIDGRMPAWQTPDSKSPYTTYLEILQTQPGWQETLDSYDIKWILISPGTFMDLLLQPDPKKYGYEERFRDSVSVIYCRLS